jgi:hypothetical protein
MALYGGLVREVSSRFENALERISAEYNFDLGDEFEIALCRTLRQVLPQKLGICRGFVIDEFGETAGDDIVIYDRMRFPTVRSLDQDDFARKEKVPIEAVYAYIEAKHTLTVQGNGDSSLSHATQQAARVKRLCSKRQLVSFSELEDNVITNYVDSELKDGFPNYGNPMFAMVFSRNVRLSESSNVSTDPMAIHEALVRDRIMATPSSDLIVAGLDNVILPCIQRGETYIAASPFFVENESHLIAVKVERVGFGVAVMCLLSALDFIHLGMMPWPRILADSMGKKTFDLTAPMDISSPTIEEPTDDK